MLISEDDSVVAGAVVVVAGGGVEGAAVVGEAFGVAVVLTGWYLNTGLAAIGIHLFLE